MKKLWQKLKTWWQARYEGAQWTANRSWLPAAVQSARFDANAATRKELVRKARYFERNSAIVNRLADLFEAYVVGQGLALHPSSSNPEWNERAKFWLDGWTEYPDLISLQSFGTFIGLAARSWFIEGEVFIVLTRGESGRPRLQLVEGHLCETPPELREMEGDTIIDGVVIDKNGRPTAYYIADEDKDGKKIFGKPKPAEFVIHLFEPARPGQYRGLPFLYPVINDLHDLDDLQILEMKAARDNAEVIHVVKNANGELSASELRRARLSTTQLTSGGTSVTETRSRYYNDTIGGRTVVMERGDEMQQFASTRPSVVTTEYWRYIAEKICAGVGIPYVLVFPDSMQGTVYRGALDMANAFFRARFEVLAAVARRIYRYTVGWARNNEPTLRDPPGDWQSVTIYPPRAVNVDVGRNSAAMLAELEAGATDYELIYGPLGLDWRERFRKRAEQEAYAKDLGLKFGAKPEPEKPEDPEKPEKPDNDEDEEPEPVGKDSE